MTNVTAKPDAGSLGLPEAAASRRTRYMKNPFNVLERWAAWSPTLVVLASSAIGAFTLRRVDKLFALAALSLCVSSALFRKWMHLVPTTLQHLEAELSEDSERESFAALVRAAESAGTWKHRLLFLVPSLMVTTWYASNARLPSLMILVLMFWAWMLAVAGSVSFTAVNLFRSIAEADLIRVTPEHPDQCGGLRHMGVTFWWTIAPLLPVSIVLAAAAFNPPLPPGPAALWNKLSIELAMLDSYPESEAHSSYVPAVDVRDDADERELREELRALRTAPFHLVSTRENPNVYRSVPNIDAGAAVSRRHELRARSVEQGLSKHRQRRRHQLAVRVRELRMYKETERCAASTGAAFSQCIEGLAAIQSDLSIAQHAHEDDSAPLWAPVVERYAAAGLAVVALALFLFASPVVAFHRAMVRSRTARVLPLLGRLASVSVDLETAVGEGDAARVKHQGEMLAGIRSALGTLQRAPVWPFDLATLAKALSPALVYLSAALSSYLRAWMFG